MKIAIIAHDVGSKEMGMLFRPYYVGQGLQRAGHEVHFVTASFSHVRRKNPEVTKDLSVTQIEGLPYHWIKSLKFNGNTIQRALGMFYFSLKLWLHARKLSCEINPDIVIATSPHPFIIYGSHRLAKLSKARLIFEVRDLWPLSLAEIGKMSPSHPFYRICQWAEDYAYKNSDRTVSLLPYASEYMQSRGLRSEKFACIPNGFDPKEYSDKKPLSAELLETLKRFKEKYPKVIGYAGAHGLANSLGSLIEAFRLLPDQNTGLILIGNGPEKKNLQHEALTANLENVLFLDPIGKDQIPSLLDFFDVAYIGLKSSPLFEHGVSPNKLIDYMAAGKAVLYAIDTKRDPVTESQCGFKVPADQPRQLAKTIEQIRTKSSSELEAVGLRGKEWIYNNLSYDRLIDQWQGLLNEARAKGKT